MKKALSLLFVAAACLVVGITPVHAATGFLKIHLLSVADGRGDCFIIELPDNTKMVVDIPDGWNTALVNKLNDLGFGGGIKYLVGTHEHSDHIGGMNNFLNSGFNINNTQIYYPRGSMNAASGAYDNLVTAAGNRGLAVTKLVAGDYIVNTTYDGKPLKVRILSPALSKVNGGSDDWSAPNEASFIIKIQYGTKGILLQADCWGYNEMEVLAGAYAAEVNNCQVLKVGHHGTAAPGGVISTRGEYLDAAGVTRALITDGDKAINDTIKSRLQARNIRYWSTGAGDGYCWLRTDGASNWEESEDPLWPAAPTIVAPSITSQPASQTVNPGANATFSVTATGTAPLGYQWRFNGVDIADANSASLTITNAQSSDAGNYSVIVENAAGDVTSANAVLTVRVPPSITTQPASQTVTAGGNVTFSVSASGTAPLSYQWRFAGVNIAGATAASYTRTGVQSNDAGNYSVVVANAAGSVTSANAVLTVTAAPPSISTQPASQTVVQGSAATFSVVASGTGTLTYQWRFNGANISGATTSSYTRSNAQTTHQGNYSVVVANSAGSVTSANASLTVKVNVILDNSNAGFTASTTWTTGTSATDKYGTNYRFRNTAAVSDPATWAANLGNTGSYTVSAWWSQGVNRSTTAPYIVYHSTGSTTVNKNQQANGGTWQSLGVYNLTAGTNRVSLSCWTTTGFVVIGDAVKWSQ
jgi:beta-lactamase superfamily II metal-dependent hydrolase